MKQTRIGVVAPVFSLVAGAPATAYTPHSIDVGGQLSPVHWLAEQFPVPFVLNDLPSPCSPTSP